MTSKILLILQGSAPDELFCPSCNGEHYFYKIQKVIVHDPDYGIRWMCAFCGVISKVVEWDSANEGR